MTTIAQNNTFFHGNEIPENAVIYANNGTILYCNDFMHKRTQPLRIMVYDKSAQKFTCKISRDKQFNDILWTEHRKFTHSHKHTVNSSYMKHSRGHKKSSGGQRDYVRSITDYECTKNPLHDFRICYN